MSHTSADRPTERAYRFTGYLVRDADDFVAATNRLVGHGRLKILDPQIATALEFWDRPHGKDQYLTSPAFDSWRDKYGEVAKLLPSLMRYYSADDPHRTRAQRFTQLWEDEPAARTERNRQWMAQQRTAHRALFASGLTHPLSDEQIDAVVRDEHRVLVVAGAGTGKTSTTVVKARWILAQALSDPARIQILAFNKAAAVVVRERLNIGHEHRSVATTFHSFGLRLVAEASGRKPRLTKLVDENLQAFILTCMDDALSDSKQAAGMESFLAYFRYPDPSPIPEERSHEANQWADGHDMRSFTGVRLRSNAEVAIANFLSLHGVDWEYEADYPFDTATAKFGQYQPDFYLPVHDLYIEHWACDDDGHLPPEWEPTSQAAYLAGMAWKQELHARKGTRLIETRSSVVGARAVVAQLIYGLRANNVAFAKIDAQERSTLIAAKAVIEPVATLIARFLALYRESGTTFQDMKDRAPSGRAHAFLRCVELIHERYAAHLRDANEIDFSDMISAATAAVRRRDVRVSLDYLLVDEFQDISRGRAALLKAVLEHNPHCRLFAVGDDWQSIYRFAGSDVDVMLHFAEHFGHAERIDLRQTHRFGSKLLDATSRFVQTNPRQLRKALVAEQRDIVPAIEVLSVDARIMRAMSIDGDVDPTDAQVADEMVGTVSGGEDSSKPSEETVCLTALLARIASEAVDDNARVLILGRYSHSQHMLPPDSLLPPGLRVEFSTMHKAKGREADYVILLQVVAGRYGVPSEIEDDPVLNLVLWTESGIRNAEERRLFYVAMTRCRYKAFIMTSDQRRSSFVEELEREEYSHLVISSDASTRVAACPGCNGQTLVQCDGPFGLFYACSSYLCKGKALRCPHCGSAGLIRAGSGGFRCLLCEGKAEACPNCTLGFLKHIPGGTATLSGKAYPPFDACSTNRRTPLYRCFVRSPCRC